MEENLVTYYNFLRFEQQNGVKNSPVMPEVEVYGGFKQIALLYSPREDGLECTVIFLRDRLYKYSCYLGKWPGWQQAILNSVWYTGSLKKDLLDDLNYRRKVQGDFELLDKETDALIV